MNSAYFLACFTQILWRGRQRKACRAAAGIQNLQEIHSPAYGHHGTACASNLISDMGHGKELLHSGRLQHGVDDARSLHGVRHRPLLDLIAQTQKPGFV